MNGNFTFSKHELDSILLVDSKSSVKKSFGMNKITKGLWIVGPTTLLFSENNDTFCFRAYDNTDTSSRVPGLPDTICPNTFKSDSRLIRLTRNEFQCRGNFIHYRQVIYESAYPGSKKHTLVYIKL